MSSVPSPSTTTCVLVGGVALFASFDVWWFLRLAFTKASRFFRKRIDMQGGEEGVILSLCAPTDTDYFCHMNNARYLREMDFGRFDYYFRSDLGAYFSPRHRAEPLVQHAALIRYRRPINFLTPFRLHTKLVYFDERSLYFEQRFVSVHDGFVRAVALCQNTAKNTDVAEVMKRVMGMDRMDPPPEVVKKFLEANEVSSHQLRAEAVITPAEAMAKGKKKEDSAKEDEGQRKLL